MELKQPSLSKEIISIASCTGGNVLLSADKTHFLSPASARYLSEQLSIAADKAEYPTPKPIDKKTFEDEMKLISVCQEIGTIAERNNQYTLSLTLHINKPVESLTVAQLLAFHRECNKRFNQGVSHA